MIDELESNNIEKDWITAAGYRAVVVHRSLIDFKRWRCGYVGITEDHSCYGLDYEDKIPSVNLTLERLIDVHGGVTYAGNDQPVQSDLWWIGFDCAHGMDNEEGGQPLAYCIAQCESMAVQLRCLSESAIKEDYQNGILK